MCDIIHVVGEPVSHRRVSVLLGYLYSRSGVGVQSKLVTRFIVVEPVAVDGFPGGDWSPSADKRGEDDEGRSSVGRGWADLDPSYMRYNPRRKPRPPPPHQTQLSKLLRRPPSTTIKKQRLRLRRIPLPPSKLSLPRRPSRLLTRKLSHPPHLMENHGPPLCQSTSKLEDLSFNKDTKPSRARANPSLNPSLIPNLIATPSEHSLYERHLV